MRCVRIGREHTEEHRAAEATGGDGGGTLYYTLLHSIIRETSLYYYIRIVLLTVYASAYRYSIIIQNRGALGVDKGIGQKKNHVAQKPLCTSAYALWY